jgi:hypothetical protein
MEGLMAKHAWAVVCLLVVSLAWPGKALPQTPSPEALAAAKELMTVSKMTDQLKQILPAVTQQVRTFIVAANPRAEQDFDAFAPVLQTAMETRLQAFVDEGAKIYARHFTAEELRQVRDFYRTPTGEKFIREQPEVLKESMSLGQQWGQAIALELKERMTEELRKRGHNI